MANPMRGFGLKLDLGAAGRSHSNPSTISSELDITQKKLIALEVQR